VLILFILLFVADVGKQNYQARISACGVSPLPVAVAHATSPVKRTNDIGDA